MGLDQLAHLRIVLVEPAGPINVGAAARVMKNMGLHHLVLVNPQCDPTSTAAWRMAVHGREVLAAAQIVNTLPEALVGCQRAVATTGRIHPQRQGLETPEQVLPWLLAPDSQVPLPTALIFGPEDRGLSNEELVYAQRWIRIPASDAYPSLNLAQAVAVCGYLLHRQATDPSATLVTSPPPWPLTPSTQGAVQRLPWIKLKDFTKTWKRFCSRSVIFTPILPPVAWPNCGHCCTELNQIPRNWLCLGAFCGRSIGPLTAPLAPPRVWLGLWVIFSRVISTVQQHRHGTVRRLL
jgi:tRNA/rRNA methyltransferase